MKTLALLLLLACSASAQQFQYEFIVDSHVKPDSTQIIDAIFSECGYFTVSIDTIKRFRDGHKEPFAFPIKYRVLDLECKCFYYFTYDDYVIVVNPNQYILIAELQVEIMFTRTYYLKPLEPWKRD